MYSRTRIVATLGPATDRPGVLERLLEAGLDVARINFSHGTSDEHEARIRRFRRLADKRPVAVLADLPGPKLRVVLDQPLVLEQGTRYDIRLADMADGVFAVTEPEALARVAVGHRVLLDDGRIQGRVVAASPTRIQIEISDGGTLLPKKGINLPDSHLAIPALTERDREAVATAMRAGVDWLALSFVREAAAAEELRAAIASARAALGQAGAPSHVPILAKIERPEAVERAEHIVGAFDGIMVARGDLGVEIALEKVPHVQKRLINLARLAGKPVITATDMLDSMRHNPRPTRAEASDVANAVYDGTDAVMLSGETAVGEHPIEALECMKRILLEAESHQLDDCPRGVAVPKADLDDHITHLTCELAAATGARAIIVPTVTGRTARLVARHRPPLSILAVTAHETVLRQLCLVWGVRSILLAESVAKGEDRLAASVRAAFASGGIQAGDRAVVLAGHPVEGGERLPTVRVVRVGEDGRSGKA